MQSNSDHASEHASSSVKVNVLVFSGPGVSQSCLMHLKTALRGLLSTRYDVLSISAESLIRDPWTTHCALLAFPGGRDLGYLSSLGEAGCKRISDWVRAEGGRYLGLCAGAYFASSRIVFEQDSEDLKVVGDRPLKFFPGACTGTAFPGFAYGSESGARDAVISLEGDLWRQLWQDRPPKIDIYYNGGGYFDEPAPGNDAVQVIARYDELTDKPPAGMLCQVGQKGKAVLWGVHPEHPSAIAAQGTSQSTTSDHLRSSLLRATLRMLDLDVPADTRSIVGPTPLLLTSERPPDAAELMENIQSQFPDAHRLEDLHDQFEVFQQIDLSRVFQIPISPEVPRLRIVVCSTSLPDPSYTPIFNLQTFYSQLHTNRQRQSFPYRPSFGSDILYGEVVTSTQTVLEKNPRFQKVLPSGFVFVGSHQIAGRGRGSNNWLSPPGCLQFSLLLRVPRTLGHQLVFAQYLFGLSVVEAVRSRPGYSDVGLRLKWPNDLYADMGTDGLRKIGGILVNSSFVGDNFTVIIGCGINTTNSGPTTSLLDLINHQNEVKGTSLPIITQEEILAAILPTFEAMWNKFEHEASFASFEPLYRRRWLHSDKEVTIQETGQRVRIVGLAPETGYLRTSDLSNDSPLPAYIDLQPDGNSFDMLQGLLKVKR